MCINNIKKYIADLKEYGVDETLFEIVKKQKQGEQIHQTEDLMYIHRQIIDSIIQKTPVYEEITVLENITKQDIDDFVREYLGDYNMVVSKVIEKNVK